MTILFAFFIFIFGLVFGSFGNVLIYRLPRRQSIIKPASHCPECGEPLKYHHNIPLLSYLLLGGKCAYCGVRISFRYFLVEALMGLLFLGLFLKFGLSAKFFHYAIFLFLMTVHAFIDYEHYLFLDKLNFTGGVLGILSVLLLPGLNSMNALFGAIFGAGLLALAYFSGIILFQKKGMGWGDLKTGLVCGIFLGALPVIYMLLVAAILGIFWGLFNLIRDGGSRKLPFGTLMGIASAVMVFFGNFLLEYALF